MKTPKVVLTDEECTRVRRALDIIEQAQNLINLAASELCPVQGFADEWSAAYQVHDTVKDYWCLVERRRQHLTP